MAGGFVAVFFMLKNQNKDKAPDNSLVMLQNQIAELRSALDSNLGQARQESRHTTSEVNQKMQESMRILGDVKANLAKVESVSQQTLSMNEQLKKLQDTLTNAKQRGNFGEYRLESLLSNIFTPKEFQMQYKFKNGDSVDAALKFGGKIIPIDSKFSLENYNRLIEAKNPSDQEAFEKSFKQDLKNRIDETAKYIRPEEGTLEFAFMFIPAEAIYYDLLVNTVGATKVNTRDLIDYAIKEKRVHIVSPTTLYVTLQALWHAMNAYKIQESTQEILKNVRVLSGHLKGYDDYFKKIGKNLKTTIISYNEGQRELGKIDKDFLKLEVPGINIKIDQIEPPASEE